jgi:hypothetical protein
VLGLVLVVIGSVEVASRRGKVGQQKKARSASRKL